MKIDILTIFPEAFSYFDYSIPKIAQQKKLIDIKIHDLRKWANNKHNRVDDKPFGGGAGMVLMLEPIYRAIKELKTEESRVILTSAQGVLWDQKKALQLFKIIILI
ncbi:MAG: hypothetical protein KatS3mg085_209 [Candidatus Dojkabacteria bacterium]|nr:MAG: hypothetical protein KatS3mg085_209 [Candidatus Dojkabacteria bacterium]